MKFEIRDPSAPDDQPWPSAVLEILPVWCTKFIPEFPGADGMPHRTDDGSVKMMMLGRYGSVEEERPVWTLEVPTIESLIAEFKDFQITISQCRCKACAGLLEFEEPPSVFSSYS